MDATINLNQVPECIREVHNMGNDITMNICTGEQVMVPWGNATWLINLAIVVPVVTFLFLMLMFIAVGLPLAWWSSAHRAIAGGPHT